MRSGPGGAGRLIVAAALIGLGVRVVRSRHRRFLHPDGRSFAGELEVWGSVPPVGAPLVDRPGRHPVTVRLSKGMGTRAGRADIRGLAFRVPVDGGVADILLSTAGTGRLTQFLPAPRRTFDTWYGSIGPYRTGAGRKVYLGSGPEQNRPSLGRSLASVAAAGSRAGLLLYARTGGATRPFGRLSLGRLLPSGADAALAFDPIGNAPADLRPVGIVHGTRAAAYRLSQRWRGARPRRPTAAAGALLYDRPAG